MRPVFVCLPVAYVLSLSGFVHIELATGDTCIFFKSTQGRHCHLEWHEEEEPGRNACLSSGFWRLGAANEMA